MYWSTTGICTLLGHTMSLYKFAHKLCMNVHTTNLNILPMYACTHTHTHTHTHTTSYADDSTNLNINSNIINYFHT